MKKVAVIILDGMSYDVLDILFKKGCMPYVKKLSDTGTNLMLQSDIPITIAAWTAMITGKKPFDSGINDQRSINYNYELCRRTLSTKTIWHILNEHNKSIGIYNAPCVKYPVVENGFLVTGKGGPTKNSDFAYPYSIKKDIMKIWGGNFNKEINKLKYRKSSNALIERVRSVNIKNTETCKFLVDKYNPEFFTCFFTETDKLFHVVYDDLMNMEDGNVESEKSLLSLFSKIDENIKQIFSSMGDDVEKIIVSDHGFGHLDYRFDLEKWLIDKGYLKLEKAGASKSSKNFFSFKNLKYLIPRRISNYIRRYTKQELFNDVGYEESVVLNKLPIKWDETLAFPITGIGLYINDTRFKKSTIKNKEDYLNLRNKIVDELKQLKLPDGRDPFPDIVVKKNSQAFGKDGPDIAINANITVPIRPSYENNNNNSYFVKTEKGDKGTHRRNGIFIGNGSYFSAQSLDKVFDHSELPNLLLDIFGIESENLPNNLASFLKKIKHIK